MDDEIIETEKGIFETAKEFFARVPDFDEAAAIVGGYVGIQKPGDPICDDMAMLKRSKELGRPLTDDEAEEFIIDYVK